MDKYLSGGVPVLIVVGLVLATAGGGYIFYTDCDKGLVTDWKTLGWSLVKLAVIPAIFILAIAVLALFALVLAAIRRAISR